MEFNPIRLEGKRILVTGAASGIGRATGILLSQLGAEVVLVDIDSAGMEQTAALCPGNTFRYVINLKEPEEIKEGISAIAKKLGKLNGLVHCAGMPYLSPLKSITGKSATEVFMLNTYAALELSKCFVSRTVCTGNSDSIVLISSVYGKVGSAANAGYAMSKSALHGVTRSLAIELAPRKIRVNCIAPGFIKGAMLADVAGKISDPDYDNRLAMLHPLGMGTPEDVANMVGFLQSDMSVWITGAILSVDGGFTAQ